MCDKACRRRFGNNQMLRQSAPTPSNPTPWLTDPPFASRRRRDEAASARDVRVTRIA
jgi:hypothetical protein